MSMLSREAIDRMGFLQVGKEVMISDKASFYNCQNISIGDHCRIDDFCILSAGKGGITLGNYIHIAAYTSLIGAGKITLSHFCNLSSKVAIYSSNDDYSGRFMTNPMVPSRFTNVTHADVFLGKHVIIGCGSVLLPGVTLEDGVAIGALSVVKENCSAFQIYAGNPAKKIKNRDKALIHLEQTFMSQHT